MDNKLLLIVDPQIDFISGTLPVAGARSAMDALAAYIRENGDAYSGIVVTADRHPIRHSSFASEGGEWPAHCVADSVGAAIWPSVMDAIMAYGGPVTVLHKGEDPDRDEYSIFRNSDAAERLLRLIGEGPADTIDICGLAGDICVAATVADCVQRVAGCRIRVLVRFSPSIDGGSTLDALIRRHSLVASDM